MGVAKAFSSTLGQIFGGHVSLIQPGEALAALAPVTDALRVLSTAFSNAAQTFSALSPTAARVFDAMAGSVR